MMINIAHYLEMINGEWADQLAIYSWLCGEEIGSDFIAAIDQLSWRNGILRVAQHRSRIEANYQFAVFANAQNLWSIVNSDYIFRDLDPSESISRCQLLEDRAAGLCNPVTEDDDLFNQLTRGSW
jgi:hypothetical protein